MEEKVVASGTDDGIAWELRVLESQFTPRLGDPSMALRRGHGSVIAPLCMFNQSAIEHAERAVGGVLISDTPTRMVAAEIISPAIVEVTVVYDDGETELEMIDAEIAGRPVRFVVGHLGPSAIGLRCRRLNGIVERVAFPGLSSIGRPAGQPIDDQQILDH